MRNFKVRLILLTRIQIQDKLGIDLVNTIQDVIKVKTTFNTTAGYTELYGAATYDLIGSQAGNSYHIRFYARYGDSVDIQDITIDKARQQAADHVYCANLTLVEDDLFYYAKEERFPIVLGQTLTVDDFCADELSFDLKDPYGNKLCAGIGHIPSIELTDGEEVTVFKDSVWIEPGYVAMDVEDGDLTANVDIFGLIDTSVVGTQVLTYSVTDSDGGRFSIPRKVNVRLPNTLPTLTLLPFDNGAVTPINLIENDPYTDPGATAHDTEDGDLTAHIVVSGDVVDTSTPGTYNVIYSVTDLDGATTVKSRKVVVQDNQLPVITLLANGNGEVTPIHLRFGQTWIDPGATAIDPEEGDITAGIVVGGDHVDITTAGTYTVTYTVVDTNSGNVYVTRQVIVAENQYPVISLNQFNGETTPILLPWNGTYTEVGATATDLEDGDLTNDITTVGTVDTTTPGIYTITYSVTDSAGASTMETRVVTVSENVAPVITLTNYAQSGIPTPINISTGSLWEEPGYVATDAEDGDITANVVVTGSVDSNTSGTYTLTYTVTDNGGLTTTVSRVINVTAINIPPTLTLLPDAKGDTDPVGFNIIPGNVWIDPGATAYDTEDGDLTAQIITSTATLPGFDGTVNPDVTLLGEHIITYKVTDADGATTTKSRTLNIYEDYAPELTLLPLPSGTINGQIANGSTWTEPGYTATDIENGDITGDVVVGGDTVDTSVNGTYTLQYSVTDSDGNTASATRIITVVNNAPIVTLLGPNPQVITYGNAWIDPGATAYDVQDGDLTNNIVVGGDTVDVFTAGNYMVTYSVSDSDGGTGMVSRLVSIVSNQIPAIFLNGLNGVTTPITINQNDPWIDPGATAIDPEQGDISADIVVSGVVDNTKVGTYSLTYSVTDNGGATVTTTREVIVVGTNPVITLTPASDGAIETVWRKIDVDANYVEPGATALDNEDGNITSNITILNTTTNTAMQVGDVIPATAAGEGSYRIEYNVADSDGLTDTKSRTVIIDYMTCNIVLEPDAYGNINDTFVVQGSSWSEPGYHVTSWETTLTGSVVTSGDTVDTNNPLGTVFTLRYNYSDSHGGVAPEVIRTVTVVEAETIVTLLANSNGDVSPIDITAGDPWNDPGATAWDITHGDITGNIVVGGDTVDNSTVGSYNITYSVNDTTAASVTRVVNIVANQLPIITLLGDNPMNITNGDVYSDPGATATDIEDGDISADIVVGGDVVDTSIDGVYNVTYTVVDSNGGETIETRVVNVLTACGLTIPDPDYTIADTGVVDMTMIDYTSTIYPITCPSGLAPQAVYIIQDTTNVTDHTITDY